MPGWLILAGIIVIMIFLGVGGADVGEAIGSILRFVLDTFGGAAQGLSGEG